ncbi:MAG: hypothetical protein WA421_05030 [Nitrososphaeraceae archaeon]
MKPIINESKSSLITVIILLCLSVFIISYDNNKIFGISLMSSSSHRTLANPVSRFDQYIGTIDKEKCCHNNNNNFTAAATPILTQTTVNVATSKTAIDSGFGIKIRYENGWSIDTRSYPAGDRGIQIAALYLPDVSSGLPSFYVGIDNLSTNIDGFPVSLNEYLKQSREQS